MFWKKEVMLKSDIEEYLKEQIKYYQEAWLPSEMYRVGALEALRAAYMAIHYKHGLKKGSENK